MKANEKKCFLTKWMSEPVGYHLWECNENKYEVNKIYRYKFLTTGQIFNILQFAIFLDCFYEVNKPVCSVYVY